MPYEEAAASTEWRVDWATETDMDPRLLFGLHLGMVSAVAMDVVSERPLIAGFVDAGPMEYRLWACDLLSGRTIETFCEAVATCLSFGHLDGEPALVSGHEDGRLQFWSMADGSLQNTIVTCDEKLRDLYLAGSEAVTRDWTGSIRRWSVPTGELLGVITPSQGLALCGGRLTDGRHVLLTCDEGLTLWDVPSWYPQRLPVPSEFKNVRGAMLSIVDGRDCVTIINEYFLAATFDLETFVQIGAPIAGHINRRGGELTRIWRGSEPHAKPAVVGETIVVPTRWRVHLWDLRTRHEERPPLAGPVAQSRVAAVHWQGRDLLLTASSYDGVLALHDLGRPVDREPGHDQRISGIALTPAKDAVVSVDEGGTILARRASDGHPLAAPLNTGVEVTHAITAWQDQGDIIAATGSGSTDVSDKRLYRWNVTRGGRHGEPIEAHRRFVPWIQRAQVREEEVLVTTGGALPPRVGQPSVIRVWSTGDGALLGEASTDTRSMTSGFVTGIIDGHPVAVLSTYSQPMTLLALDDLSAPLRHIPQAEDDIVLDIINSHIIAAAATPEHNPSGEIHAWDAAGNRFGPGVQGTTGATAVAVKEWPEIYIGWEDGTVTLVDLTTGELRKARRFPRRPTALTVLGNGGLIVAFGSDLARVAIP
ncbi:WD40 repeat domain-containing protein [Actinomadura sp. 9N215]|uniref:WD40 repeat domain-containing protein n=1 Tax=Actinomadura sp. 9N215 TaxID=3375150 RepID=UPI00378C8244